MNFKVKNIIVEKKIVAKVFKYTKKKLIRTMIEIISKKFSI